MSNLVFDDDTFDLSRTPSPFFEPQQSLSLDSSTSSVSSPSTTTTTTPVSLANQATSVAEGTYTWSGILPSNLAGYPQPPHVPPGTNAVPGTSAGYSPMSLESINHMGYK